MSTVHVKSVISWQALSNNFLRSDEIDRRKICKDQIQFISFSGTLLLTLKPNQREDLTVLSPLGNFFRNSDYIQLLYFARNLFRAFDKRFKYDYIKSTKEYLIQKPWLKFLHFLSIVLNSAFFIDFYSFLFNINFVNHLSESSKRIIFEVLLSTSKHKFKTARLFFRNFFL